MIQDGCKIGQKGFGFIPIKNKNIKFPHIGKVVIEENVEIASGLHNRSRVCRRYCYWKKYLFR